MLRVCIIEQMVQVVILMLGNVTSNSRISSGGLRISSEPGSFKQSFYNGLRNYEVNNYRTQSNWGRSVSVLGRKNIGTNLNVYSRKHTAEMKSTRNYLKTLDLKLSKPKRFTNAQAEEKYYRKCKSMNRKY